MAQYHNCDPLVTQIEEQIADFPKHARSLGFLECTIETLISKGKTKYKISEGRSWLERIKN